MEIMGLGLPEVVLAILCFLYFRKVANDDGLVPWDWPVLGMLPWMLSIVEDVHDTATLYLERLGGTYLLKGPWFTNMDMLFTVDPANVRYILGDNFQGFIKGEEFHEIFDVLGNGHINSEGESWRMQRKHAQFLFNQLGFRKCVSRTNRMKLEKGLVPVLDRLSEEGVVVDMQDVLQRLTFDATVLFITGYDPGCLSPQLPHVPFCKAMDASEEVIFIRHVIPQFVRKLQKWLNIGPEKKMSEAKEIMDEVLYGYISRKREELSLKGITSVQDYWDEEGVDLLTLYLTEEDKSLQLEGNDKFVKDIVLNMVLAGRDTTSSTLTWFLWLVMTHPVVKAKIRAELLTKIPQSEAEMRRLFSEDELNNVPYLLAALNETLRLYPASPFQRKEPVKPDILPTGHHVHPKLRVQFSLYAMGRMPFIWGEDCCKFKPERWLTEKGAVKFESPYKFNAFSAGPRTCIGTKLGYTQMKLVAAALVHNYEFHLAEGHKVAPNLSMILYMKHGLKVKVANRWSED